MKEQVNHPEHYQIKGRKECWDEFIDDYGPEYTFIWCILTGKKYLYRAGKKDDNPEEQDLMKARAYHDKALDISRNYPTFISTDLIDMRDELFVSILHAERRLNF